MVLILIIYLYSYSIYRKKCHEHANIWDFARKKEIAFFSEKFGKFSKSFSF